MRPKEMREQLEKVGAQYNEPASSSGAGRLPPVVRDPSVERRGGPGVSYADGYQPDPASGGYQHHGAGGPGAIPGYGAPGPAPHPSSYAMIPSDSGAQLLHPGGAATSSYDADHSPGGRRRTSRTHEIQLQGVTGVDAEQTLRGYEEFTQKALGKLQTAIVAHNVGARLV